MKIFPLVAVMLLAFSQSGCLTYRATRYAVRKGRETARHRADARREARDAEAARDANAVRDPQDSRTMHNDRRTDAEPSPARTPAYDGTGMTAPR